MKSGRHSGVEPIEWSWSNGSLSCDASGIDEHHQATIKPTYCRKNATFLVTIAGEKIHHLNGQASTLGS
jgi:hypothetical protein